MPVRDGGERVFPHFGTWRPHSSRCRKGGLPTCWTSATAGMRARPRNGIRTRGVGRPPGTYHWVPYSDSWHSRGPRTGEEERYLDSWHGRKPPMQPLACHESKYRSPAIAAGSPGCHESKYRSSAVHAGVRRTGNPSAALACGSPRSGWHALGDPWLPPAPTSSRTRECGSMRAVAPRAPMQPLFFSRVPIWPHGRAESADAAAILLESADPCAISRESADPAAKTLIWAK